MPGTVLRPLFWDRRHHVLRILDQTQLPLRRSHVACRTVDQVVEAITLAYLSLYVLSLGATRSQIGWMSALASLSAALMLLPGAALAGRLGSRKPVVLLSGGGIARAALLSLALAPLAAQGPAVVSLAIGLAVVREAFANLGLPAWVSLTADIVPLKWRGRYFGSRNFAMGLMGMATTLVVGQLITQAGSPLGYQLTFGLAFATGLASTFSFSRLREPPAPPLSFPTTPAPRPSLLQHFRAHPEFFIFCAVVALWNFSLNVAGPFFNVYVVEGLNGDAGAVGILSVVSALSGLPGQRVFGNLTDRWGPRRVQLLTGLLIPILPLAWVFVRSPWHVIPINLVAGFLWAGYTLASFNLLLTMAPADQRPAYTALYQIVVLASLGSGAAVGGLVIADWGYQAVFVLSATGRLLAALLFAWLVRGDQPRK